ncbi:MAG: hypothetical protein CMJ59_19775 [Planctomycetaceae bacterium]|nr:hypothetical protein [Planctomycetaceae bacterium]
MPVTPGHALLRFCRLRLGLKPFVDYAQSRRCLNGIAQLPIGTVFDVGAHVGKMTRRYRKLFPNANIYCFEPLPDCYRRLQRWANRQGDRVQAFNMALGNASGQVDFFWNQSHPGGSSLRAPETPHNRETHVSLTTRMEKLDDVVASLTLRGEILIKLDVEGAELEVLEGARNLLGQASAIILEAAIGEERSRPHFHDLLQTLEPRGFLYRGNLGSAYVDGVPRLVDAVFIKPPSLRRIAA